MPRSEDSVKHLARLTQQLSQSTGYNSLGNTQNASSQSSSINNARYNQAHRQNILVMGCTQALTVLVQLMQKLVKMPACLGHS